jgi:hypothetical protein
MLVYHTRRRDCERYGKIGECLDMRAIRTSRRLGMRRSWPILIGIPVLLLMAGAWLLALGLSTRGAVIIDEAAKLNTCRTSAISLIKPQQVDLQLLAHISDFCYGEVRGEDLLGDFYIRKRSFVQQQSDTGVLLWMVVAITLSGVLLAGLQLLAAFRLANAGRGDFTQGGELSLDQKSISLKSSVTGVTILTISLVFFITYVKWIYPIRTQIDPEVAATNANASIALSSNIPITLGVGGVGSAPGSGSNSVALPPK